MPPRGPKRRHPSTPGSGSATSTVRVLGVPLALTDYDEMLSGWRR